MKNDTIVSPFGPISGENVLPGAGHLSVLSPANKILQNIGKQGLSTIKSKKTFNKVWKYKPVSVKSFFNSFFREPFFPEQQKLADRILGRKPTVWTGKDRYGTSYIEANCVWGKGSGKDRTAAKILTYIAYKLNCLRNPHRSLGGRGQSSDIDLVNVSITARLAKDVFFGYFKYMVKNTIDPETGENWFKNHGGVNILSRSIEFGNNVNAYSCDSKEYTGEGLNILVAIFDEVGGFKVDRAKALDEALTDTAKSRFPKMYKIIRISYIRDINDYMMSSYRKGKGLKGIYNTKKSTWVVNIMRKKSDFADEFGKNPERANRVFGSKVTIGEASFFKYRRPIYKIFRSEHINPFVGDVISTIDIKSLKFKPNIKFDNRALHFVHYDGATGKEGCDCAGLAIGHPIMRMPVKQDKKFIEMLAKKGFNVSTKLFGIGLYGDIVLQIKAPKGGEIIFDDIYYFVNYLRSVYKLKIVKFTMDGWQSRSDIQRITMKGIESEVLSVDKKKAPYQTIKGKVYEGLVDCYYNPILSRELKELQNVASSKLDPRKIKIDHPITSAERLETEGDERGSKDVSDALAGMGFSALQYVSQFGCGYVYEQHQNFVQGLMPGYGYPAIPIQGTVERSKISQKAESNRERIEAEKNASLVPYGEHSINTLGYGF